MVTQLVRNINVLCQHRISVLILADLVFNFVHLTEVLFSLVGLYFFYLIPVQAVCLKNHNCYDYGLENGAFFMYVLFGVVAALAWSILNFNIRRIFWQHGV